MTQDLNGKVEAVGNVMAAADRLAERGLAPAEPRGLNNDGMQTLADLLAVLTFQAGSGDSQPERVASATSRAAMSAVGDLLVHLSGGRAEPAQTQRLLREALRTAKS